MRIVSFNVNSVRVREPLLLSYLQKVSPDILALQETKVVDQDFPRQVYEDLGYHVSCFGQKTYNGVAIISKEKPLTLQNGFVTDTEESAKRLQIATFATSQGSELVVFNGYFPQGENQEHPTKYPAKMKFYDDLLSTLEGYSATQDLVIMGDLNIAPTDADVGIGPQNAKRWLKTGKCSFLPEERQRIEELKNWGLLDSFREKYPDVEDQFSWFDFRSRGFAANPRRGLRIDQIWVTPSLMEKCEDAGIDYELRAQERPSDHCPIWADFNMA